VVHGAAGEVLATEGLVPAAGVVLVVAVWAVPVLGVVADLAGAAVEVADLLVVAETALDPAAGAVLVVAVWAVPVLVVVAGADLPVDEEDVAGFDVVPGVVFATPGFAVVAEALVPVVVLAVGAEVFWVVCGVVEVCGESVCAMRIPADIKLQTNMMIERFIVHPFDFNDAGKVSSPGR